VFMGNNLLRSLKISTILLCATVIFLPACDDNDEVEAEIGLTVAPSYPALNNASFASDAKVRQASIPKEGASPVKTANQVTTSIPLNKNTIKKKEDLVIGKTLKTGMSLETALSTLGIPQTIRINRGTEPERDSISVEYLNHGLRIHALTQNSTIEELEVLPEFKGKFVEGAKIGSKFSELIESFGIPESKDSFIAKYPDRGMYIFLKNDSMISVKLFAKNSKLLDHKLLIN
jgi:hypothetical protein